MPEPRRFPQTPQEYELFAHLEGIATVWGRQNPPPEWVYTSPFDFLLQHGQWFTPRPRPTHVMRGTPKRCYGNSLLAADRYRLVYCEGYALLDLGEGGIPLEHGWCCEADGQLVEVTTAEPWGAYFGIPFHTGRAADAAWVGNANILNDYRRHHPLLRQRWTGEDWTRVWPVCPPRAQRQRRLRQASKRKKRR